MSQSSETKYVWHKIKWDSGEREILTDSEFDELMESGREDWINHGELYLTEQEKEDFIIGDNWY